MGRVLAMAALALALARVTPAVDVPVDVPFNRTARLAAATKLDAWLLDLGNGPAPPPVIGPCAGQTASRAQTSRSAQFQSTTESTAPQETAKRG